MMTYDTPEMQIAVGVYRLALESEEARRALDPVQEPDELGVGSLDRDPDPDPRQVRPANLLVLVGARAGLARFNRALE